MLLVKTKIGQSSIEGIGLFADEFITKGTIIWQYTPNFDLRFNDHEISHLPLKVQEYLKIYSWKSKTSDQYCFSSDNGKYFNHSSTNNNVLSYYEDAYNEVITKALRDIEINEELIDNYSSFEIDFNESEFLIKTNKPINQEKTCIILNGRCPNCNTFLLKNKNVYCHNCGIKLDWENE